MSNRELHADGTLFDYLAGDPRSGGVTLANQTFWINGIPVPIIGFGGALNGLPTLLFNTYGPNMVTVNGNQPARECGPGDPPK